MMVGTWGDPRMGSILGESKFIPLKKHVVGAAIFAATLVLILGDPTGRALAQPPFTAPPGWQIVDTRPVEYFIFDQQIQPDVTRSQVDSRLVRTDREVRNASQRDSRELGTPVVTSSIADEAYKIGQARRFEEPFINSYDVWRTDTVKTTVTKTPYIDYRITTYEQRNRLTYSNTYELYVIYRWKDPVTGENFSHDERIRQNPVEELAFTPWVPGEDKVRIGAGTLTDTARSIMATRTDDRLVKRQMASTGSKIRASGALARTELLASTYRADKKIEGRQLATETVKQIQRLTSASQVVATGGGSSPQSAGPPALPATSAAVNLVGTWSGGLLIAAGDSPTSYVLTYRGVSIRAKYDTSDRELEGEGSGVVDGRVQEVEIDLKSDPQGRRLKGKIEIGAEVSDGNFVKQR